MIRKEWPTIGCGLVQSQLVRAGNQVEKKLIDQSLALFLVTCWLPSTTKHMWWIWLKTTININQHAKIAGIISLQAKRFAVPSISVACLWNNSQWWFHQSPPQNASTNHQYTTTTPLTMNYNQSQLATTKTIDHQSSFSTGFSTGPRSHDTAMASPDAISGPQPDRCSRSRGPWCRCLVRRPVVVDGWWWSMLGDDDVTNNNHK